MQSLQQMAAPTVAGRRQADSSAATSDAHSHSRVVVQGAAGMGIDLDEADQDIPIFTDAVKPKAAHRQAEQAPAAPRNRHERAAQAAAAAEQAAHAAYLPPSMASQVAAGALAALTIAIPYTRTLGGPLQCLGFAVAGAVAGTMVPSYEASMAAKTK